MKISREEFASRLLYRSLGHEISEAECQQAKESGLIVVFGASDDLMKFRGAIYDEVGCYDGGTAQIDAEGIVEWRGDCIEPCEATEQELDELLHFLTRRKNAKTIEAVWCGDDAGATWTYETIIPHNTFYIQSDDEDEGCYCFGIVISTEDL